MAYTTMAPASTFVGRFLIDPDGTIQAMEVMTPAVGRNVAELIRQVRAFQHVRETGEVMPSWLDPGQAHAQTGPRTGRQGLEDLETRVGLLTPII